MRVELVIPDQPPDWQRGALRRAAGQTASDFAVRPAMWTPEQAELWHLPGAADFSSDPVISNTVLMLQELKASGVAEDLIGRCAAARAQRTKRAGRKRMPGSFELLYLAFVDLGFTSRQHFHAKLTPDLLDVCGF